MWHTRGSKDCYESKYFQNNSYGNLISLSVCVPTLEEKLAEIIERFRAEIADEKSTLSAIYHNTFCIFFLNHKDTDRFFRFWDMFADMCLL